VLVRTLGRVGHDDESDVIGGQGFGGLSWGKSVSECCSGAFCCYGEYSQPSANVDIAAGDFCRSEEGVAAVASGTDDFHGVAAAVCFGGVERDGATLLAVWSVSRPCRLVPAAFEIVGYLRECHREQRERKSSEHGCELNRRIVGILSLRISSEFTTLLYTNPPTATPRLDSHGKTSTLVSSRISSMTVPVLDLCAVESEDVSRSLIWKLEDASVSG
jgi:hypothetical protein